MITFETQEDFENAVVEAIMEKLQLKVCTYGEHFVRSVEIAICNNEREALLYDKDAVS